MQGNPRNFLPRAGFFSMKAASNAMNRPADQPRNDAARRDGSPELEADPVWELLAKSPPPKAGPMFVQNVVRAARLEADAKTDGWLARALAAIRRRPVRHLAPVAAAAALAVFLAWPAADVSPVDPGNVAKTATGSAVSAGSVVSGTGDAASGEAADEFSDLEDVAAGELLAEADLSKFSDDELLVLLGF